MELGLEPAVTPVTLTALAGSCVMEATLETNADEAAAFQEL